VSSTKTEGEGEAKGDSFIVGFMNIATETRVTTAMANSIVGSLFIFYFDTLLDLLLL